MCHREWREGWEEVLRGKGAGDGGGGSAGDVSAGSNVFVGEGKMEGRWEEGMREMGGKVKAGEKICVCVCARARSCVKMCEAAFM